MNDHLKPLAEELLKWMRESKDFVTQQAPQLAGDLINRGTVNCVIGFVLAAVFALCGVYLLKIAKRLSKETRCSDDDAAPMLTWLGGLCAFLISATLLVEHIMVASTLTFAPRVYVLEKLLEMAK